MNWTVLWNSSAESELARLWTISDDRQKITRAADRIDEALHADPISVGESRSGRTRIAFERPLVVQFDVYEEVRMVYVVSVLYR
jgi:hypothetical protein